LAAGILADQLGRKHPKSAAVVLGVLKIGCTPQKYVHWPFSRTTLIESLMRMAPSGMSGNNAWGMVPSPWCVPGDLSDHGRYHFYFPPLVVACAHADLPDRIAAGGYSAGP
jgi:hypothetical protein